MAPTHAAAHDLVLDVAGLNRFLLEAFPWAAPGSLGAVVELVPGRVKLSLSTSEAQLRPGGLVSGPTLMGLADVAAFALIAAHLPDAEMALTTSLTIHFLRRSSSGVVLADATLIKLGRRTALADVRLSMEGQPGLAAHATVSYALPRPPSSK